MTSRAAGSRTLAGSKGAAATERRHRARRLQVSGLTYDQIAQEMDVSRAAVHRYLRREDETEVLPLGGGDWAFRGHFENEPDWLTAMALAKKYERRGWKHRAWRMRINLDETWPRPTRS